MAITFNASETGQGLNRSAQLVNYNAAYTCMGWAVVLTGFTGAASIIIFNLSDGTTSNMDRLDTNTNGLNIRLKTNHGGTGTVTTNSSFTAVANTNFHWALRRNSTSSIELLVNGSVVATDTTDMFSATSRSTHPNTIVNLGANATGSTTYKSTHQAYKSWQAALTDAEIAKEMKSNGPVRTANLVYASIFANDGTVLNDTSGLGGTAWAKQSAGQSEAAAANILTVRTPSTPTVTDYADCMAAISAQYTNASSVETATFERSTDGSTWTDSGETTLATTGTTTRTTTGHTTGLSVGATNYIRALWVPATGEIASGPVFVGGGASPGAGMTTLSRPSVGQGRGFYSGARPVWFSTAPDTGVDSNDDETTISKCDYISWRFDQNNTMLDAIVAAGYAGPIADQRLALEVAYGGAATDSLATLKVKYSTSDGSALGASAYTTWASSVANADDLETTLRSSESCFQHNTSATAANRLTTGSRWILNPGNAAVQACIRRCLIRRHMAVAANSVTASRRRHHPHMDNTDCSAGARNASHHPIEWSPDGFSQAYSADMAAFINNLTATGVILTGNITGSDPNSTTAVDSSTRRDLTDRVASRLSGCLYEWCFAPYTSQCDATYTLNNDGHHNPIDFDRYIAHLDIIMGRSTGAGGYAYASTYWCEGVGQIEDLSRTDTVEDLDLRYGWGMWMLTVDSARLRLFHRQADSSNSGYDRLRIPGSSLWSTNTGNPTGVATDDATSGTAALSGSTSVKRAMYRLFQNGAVVMNKTVENNVPYAVPGYPSGTLSQWEVKWLQASSGGGAASAGRRYILRRFGRLP